MDPFLAFDEPVAPRGCIKSKSCLRLKVNVFLVTFKSCFMQDPQTPNCYLANLDTEPFLGALCNNYSATLTKEYIWFYMDCHKFAQYT